MWLIVKKRTIVALDDSLTPFPKRVTRGENESLLLERVLKSFRKLVEFLRLVSGRPIYSSNPFFRRNFLHAVTKIFPRIRNIGKPLRNHERKRISMIERYKSAMFVCNAYHSSLFYWIMEFDMTFFIDVSWQIVRVRPLADYQMNNDALNDARAFF